MTTSLAQYHSRHPRYFLIPQDNTLIRVAGPQQTPWEEATEIQNISLSGLAFTAPPDLCPIVGEVIKIQFQVPGTGPTAGTMACFGLVTRLEPKNSSEMLVGVQFKKMEPAQRLALAQALAIKLRDQLMEAQARSNPRFLLRLKSLWSKKKSAVIGTLFFFVVWCGLFYVLSTILSNT